jgi:hypothetical protein
MHAIPVSVQLEYDLCHLLADLHLITRRMAHLLASEYQQIRVFCDDAIDVSLPLEVVQLRIGLVRRHDIFDPFCSQCLQDISCLPWER